MSKFKVNKKRQRKKRRQELSQIDSRSVWEVVKKDSRGMASITRTDQIPARFMPKRKKRGAQAKWFYVPGGDLIETKETNKVHRVEIYHNNGDSGFRVRMTPKVDECQLSDKGILEMQTGG